jgi:predicted nucleic acid-binding Zn ribbon protein
MDVSDHFSLEHLLFSIRTCRSCGEEKDLIADFYLIRKNRGTLPSSYSYECKSCTVKRVVESRKNKEILTYWSYPDW